MSSVVGRQFIKTELESIKLGLLHELADLCIGLSKNFDVKDEKVDTGFWAGYLTGLAQFFTMIELMEVNLQHYNYMNEAEKDIPSYSNSVLEGYNEVVGEATDGIKKERE